MNLGDISRVLEIENFCFVSKWSEKDFLYELNDNPVSELCVATINEGDKEIVVGFSDYWHTFESATISQIAVHPDYQRKGIASELLKDIISDCYNKKIANLTLEVRKNNAKAISLYKKVGFKEVLVKPHYYSNGDDAIYMIYEVNINA